ncbi:hypothetical protein Dimus_025157 [Dionaea muscipula]
MKKTRPQGIVVDFGWILAIQLRIDEAECRMQHEELCEARPEVVARDRSAEVVFTKCRRPSDMICADGYAGGVVTPFSRFST